MRYVHKMCLTYTDVTRHLTESRLEVLPVPINDHRTLYKDNDGEEVILSYTVYRCDTLAKRYV